jgi:hypothetical protein
VNIKKVKDGSYEFTQQALIDSIIQDVGLNDTKTKLVPAKVAQLLHAHKDAPSFAWLGIPIFGSNFWDPHWKQNSDFVFDSKDSGRKTFLEFRC